MPKTWFPLESNPEVMNKYMKQIGVKSENLQFCDVFGMDEELLQMVPQPSRAVLFLFPITDANEKWSKERVEAAAGAATPSDVFFMKQTVNNACGTIGIVHALANNKSRLELEPGSFLEPFLKDTEKADPAARAERLATDEKLEEAQGEAAQAGQTKNQSIDAKINLHFICYVHSGGRLYELDGRKPCALDCGATTSETLLKDTAAYAKKYMALDPEELNFTLVSLSEV